MNNFRNIALLIVVVFTSCLDTGDLSELELESSNRNIAFPIIDTSIDVTDFENESESGNVKVISDQEGKVTVQYDGQVVSRDWSIISPPLPLAPFVFQSSVTDIEIVKPGGGLLLVDEIINRIEFKEWNISYRLNHQFAESITVTFTIPQIVKNGEPYTESLTVPSEGETTTFFTEPYSLEGYVFSTTNNEFQIIYDARLPDGTQVEFDESNGVFQPFNPSYVEGYLGRDVFEVQGSIVPVNLFSIWKSGGAVFENPQIEMYVENALGLPLSAEFDIFSITTTSGDTIDVQAEVIENGISLNYPTLAEKGEAKITTFTFDKNNSNIKDLFAERVRQVNYKIDAIYNKENIVDETQFIGEGGYFSANVAVVLPLEGIIDNLELQDTMDINIAKYDEILSGELKSIVENEYPLDLNIQGYFLDEEGVTIDSLYEDRYKIKGADVDSEGFALDPESQTTFTNITPVKWSNIRSSKRLVVNIKLDTKTINDSPLWIYDDYDIILKLGAKIEVNIN